MDAKLEKKLLNFLIFFDLPKLTLRMPEDFTRMLRIQNRRVKKLVRTAYEIPFYRERFDRAGVTPDDINTAEDLAKLPLLTKE